MKINFHTGENVFMMPVGSVMKKFIVNDDLLILVIFYKAEYSNEFEKRIFYFATVVYNYAPNHFKYVDSVCINKQLIHIFEYEKSNNINVSNY